MTPTTNFSDNSLGTLHSDSTSPRRILASLGAQLHPHLRWIRSHGVKTVSKLSSGPLPTRFPSGRVLRFSAFFQEAVEPAYFFACRETARRRDVGILYYLDDDTISVILEKESAKPASKDSPEPSSWGAVTTGSGGARYHRRGVGWAKGSGETGEASGEADRRIFLRDLKVGKNVELFSRVFHVTGCDKETEGWLANNCFAEASAEACGDAGWTLLEDLESDHGPRELELSEKKGESVGDKTEAEEKISSIETCKEEDPNKTPIPFNPFDESPVLRFEARLLPQPDTPGDGVRAFCVTVHFAPGPLSVSIFEEKIRNSGFAGGLYLKKTQLLHVQKPRDVFVGAEIKVYCRIFRLVRADERTLSFMEKESRKWGFAVADVEKVREKEAKGEELNAHEKVTLLRAAERCS